MIRPRIRPALPLRTLAAILAIVLATLGAAASAKDSLGVYSSWAAFRDPGALRCYAIAQPRDPVLESEKIREYTPYATIATWPRRSVRNQVHVRLSRKIGQDARVRMVIGNKGFTLTGGGGDAWGEDKAMDAAIVAAMRSGARMNITSRDSRGRRFTDRYTLKGAATAIDAAVLGCAKMR